MTQRALETLPFDNTYTGLPEAFYAKLNPTPFSDAPYLVAFNASVPLQFSSRTKDERF